MVKLLAIVLTLLGAGSASDEADIRRSFERYRDALATNNGKAAYAQIDRASHAYYAEILDKTKFASPSECSSFSALDKLSVLLGRVQIPMKELARLDGEDYFRYAVDHGWVSQVGDENVTIEKIDVNGAEALLFIRRDEEVSPFPHIFRKEEGEWRLSLVDMFPIAEEAFQKHLGRVGVEEQDYLFDTVEAAVGVRPTEQTWEAPLKRGD